MTEPDSQLPLPRGPKRLAGYLTAGGIAIILLALLVWPLLLAVKTGFVRDGQLSLYWLGRVFANPTLMSELGRSFTLACTTMLGCIIIAVPLALIRNRYSFTGQGALSVLLLLPLILPPFVGALAMRQFLGQFGTLNLVLDKLGLINLASGAPDWLGSGFWGVAILQVLHLYPIMYLNVSAALANVDPAFVQAARNLGASPVRTTWSITLPLIRPGLFAGGTIIFIWAFTDIGTPAMLGLDGVAAVRVFKDLLQTQSSPRTFSLVFLLLSASVGLYVLGKFVFGRTASVESSKATVAAETHRLGLAGTIGVWAAFGSVVLLSIIPHIGVVLTAVSQRWVSTILPEQYTLDHLRFVLTRPETLRCITNSLKYASLSTSIDLVLGCLIAWIVVRWKIRGSGALDGLAMLPLAIPGIIMAAGYVALTASGPLRRIGPMGAPTVILVIAYSVRRLPFVVRGISAGLQQVPVALEEAARNLGSSSRGAAIRVTVPLIMANIIAAGVLAFSFAMLEVSDSLILAQLPDHYPITKEIYNQANSGNRDAYNIAAALGVYGMVLLGGTLAVASALLGRRLGAIFRA